MGSNKTIYSKLPKVRLDIFMPWAIRAAVATALIMWSNELEKWWLGGCMAERYSWQLSSAQLSLLSVLGRCMKWDEQYYDRRASWMRNCFLCHGSIISWSLPKSLLTFLESFKNPKESIGNLLENFSRGWPKKKWFLSYWWDKGMNVKSKTISFTVLILCFITFGKLKDSLRIINNNWLWLIDIKFS